jgi:MerR family transcriptional regulator, redox-sensitive transcriptional activator SoxR
MLNSRDLRTVRQVSDHSGFAPSALRFYERIGLLAASRTSGGQRRYERNVLRRLAFVRAARNVGLSLDEVEQALSTLPRGRAPNRSDWVRLSRGYGGAGWTSRETP